MIGKDLQPFSIVEDSGFRSFIKELDPNYSIPSRWQLAHTFLPQVYSNCVEKVAGDLKLAKYICLTTDGWTSISKEGFLSLTSHFISPDWKLNGYILHCKRVTEQHTAENLKSFLEDVTDKWELRGKVCAVVTDNASNIVAAVQLTKWPHLACLAHTINLIVIESIKSTGLDVLKEKCKTIVEHFHRSVVASDKLKLFQKNMGHPELKLINECKTRWNSFLYMFQRLLILKEPLEATMSVL